MTDTEFEKLVNERLDVVRNILLVKGKEYTRNNDRFNVFRKMAARTGITVLEAIDNAASKHYSAFLNMIEDVKADKIVTIKEMDDRFTDILIYTLLSEAAVSEHNDTINNAF